MFVVKGGEVMIDYIEKNRNYEFSGNQNDNGEILTADEVHANYSGMFKDKIAGINDVGLRKPQYGALCSIRSHWTLSDEPATIVLPTGTGKSETMLSVIASLSINKTLIVVPSNLLREQTFSNSKKWGILKDIGCIDKFVLNPNTLCLKSNIKDLQTFTEAIEKSNIIVTTVSLLNNMELDQVEFLTEYCDLLIIDEAHHVSSITWQKLKMKFGSKKILQFTATPYRQDGKTVDGKIIYNYPMHKAIEDEYFKPIQFIPVEEYDDSKVDSEIARKAVECLKEDLDEGYNHILLVRANKVQRAESLYKEIYSQYSEYNPVLITNDVPGPERKKLMENIKSCKSRIVVCVDMFGEGIDIPNLKIAALHDKYKSLPITLQFIGRFARSKNELGSAKIVANIADVPMMSYLSKLYEDDADWNKLLPIFSENNIQNKISLDEIFSNFENDNTDIDLKLFCPKVSMMAYTYKGEMKWKPEKWTKVIEESSGRSFLNKKDKILVLLQPFRLQQEWTRQKNIEGISWNFYVIYWNAEHNFVCLNASDYKTGRKLLKEIFSGELDLINSEKVFRCLANIKRLVLASVGLNSGIHGPVSYKMFAGIDVALGLSESTKSNCYKSNIFGLGYEGDGRISIGCSYKGKIWSRWVENVSFWKKWCDKTVSKLMDPSNDSRILDNLLIREEIQKMPEGLVAYKMDFEVEPLINVENIYIETFNTSYYMEECELKVGNNDGDKQFFKVCCRNKEFNYCLELGEDGYKFTYLDVNNTEPAIVKGRNPSIPLSKYFMENPPIIYYVGSKVLSLQGNCIAKPYAKKESSFSDTNCILWDWESLGVNIRRESRLDNSGNVLYDSIQYATIVQLKDAEKYSIIFDDDSAGEIADIVAIREGKEEFVVELYHCKFSKEDKPGARVGDLYEVCGQAERSVFWKSNAIKMLERMEKREQLRMRSNKISRFIVGNLKILRILSKKMTAKPTQFEIFMVQPGVSFNKLTPEMRVVLGGAVDFCKDVYSVPVKLICSY